MAIGGARQRLSLSRRGLAVVLAGAALLAAAIFPRYYPAVRTGPRCSELAPPLGGNNRSVLAFNSDQRGALDLELVLDKESFRSGEAVTLRLTFINEDQGPIILHLNRDEPIITANPAVAGVTFEITRVGGGAPIADQGRTYQSPTTFNNRDTLHLLARALQRGIHAQRHRSGCPRHHRRRIPHPGLLPQHQPRRSTPRPAH